MKKHLLLTITVLTLLRATHVFAYQVWVGTHCMPSNSAAFLNSWSNTAARVTGFDANPTPCLPTAGNPDQNDTSCSVAQYNVNYGAFACQSNGANIYCELDRIQISTNPADYYSSMTNVVQGRFGNAASYGYNFGSIMFYDDVSPYLWSASEVQQMRDYLNQIGETNVGLIYDCRNDSQAVESWCTNALVNNLVIEAGADLWFAGNGARTNLLRFLWTNAACAGKEIIFQMPTISTPPPYSQTNNFMVQRELLPWLGNTIMGFDFLRSSNVVFMPCTYNNVTMTWIPEIAATDAGHYTNTISSLVLSLIEQRAVFEGRTGVLPGQSNADSFVRAPYPGISALANQTVNVNTSSAALPFSVSSPAVAPAALGVSAYSSNPYLMPDSNLVLNTWSSTDVGSVGVAGSNTLGDVITLSASGADFSGTADGGRFIYQPLAGDGAIVARVTYLQPVNAWSKAGVMMRAGTNAGSVNCFMHVSASNGVEFTWRNVDNGMTSNKVVAGISAPCWVRLVKTSTNFSGYYAPDLAGAPGTWVQVGAAVGIGAMGSNLLSGLAGTSHNNTTNFTASFDNLSGNSNQTLTVTPALNQAGTTTINLTVNDGWFSTITMFTVTVPGGTSPPTITLATNAVTIYGNSSNTVNFTVGDAQTPVGSLLVAGTSENTNLVPNANLVFGGSGATRKVTIIPVTNQTGTAMINLGVSDGTNSAGASLLVTVLPPHNLFQAITTGPINDTNTWGVPLPVPGDTNIWQTGSFLITMTNASPNPNTETFNGGTFDIQAGGEFAPNAPTATLTLNNLVLDGGTIYMGNNSGLTINLSGKTFTLNSGTLQASSTNTNNRTINFQNGSLAGSGTIEVTGTQTNGAFVAFQSSINTKGFTGTFDVQDYGIFRLPAITSANASFGLNVSGTGLYYNNTAVELTLLVINGTNIPPGTYIYSSFTPAQQSFIGNNGGTITVVNSAPTLAPVGDQSMIAGQTLTITNVAADPNSPPQILTFSLLSPPAGAGINSSNGVFTWRPTIAQSPGYYPVTVKVADNGSPSLSDTNSFNVTVAQPMNPVVSAPGFGNGLLTFAVNGDSGPDYIVLVSTNFTNWTPLGTNSAATPPFTFTDAITNASQRFYRVLLGP